MSSTLGGVFMRKNLLVFCCATLLTALLFGCNGVPAFAASGDTNAQLVKTEKGKKSAEITVLKESVKKEKPSKKNKKNAGVKKYIKKGIFDYKKYTKDIGADLADQHSINVDFLFQEGFFISICTSKQREENRYYIAIGFLDFFEDEYELTYFTVFDDWEDSVKLKKDIFLPSSGLQHIKKIASYMVKNSDPYKKPEIKGTKWDWRDASEFADSH